MILLRQCDPCGNKVVESSLDETYYTEADSPELTVTLPATYPAGSSLRVVIKNNNGVVVKSHDYTLPLAANPIILDPLTWGRYTVAAMILYETTRIACKSDALTFFVSKAACTNCGYAPYRIACTIGNGGEFADLSACGDYGTGSARLMLPAPSNSISATLVQTASPCVWTAVTNTSPLLEFREYADGDCEDDDPAITNTSLTWTLTRTSGTEWTLVVTLTATGDEIYRSVTTQSLCEDPFTFTGNTATDFPLPDTDHGTGVPDLVGEQSAEATPLNDAVTMPRLQRECGTFKLLRGCTPVPPPPPKDICTEFGLDPSLALKFTWSGTLTRCTDCWDINERNHWGCTAAPTSLPNFTNSLSCLGPSAALPSSIILAGYIDYCGGDLWTTRSDGEGTCLWSCVDGLFRLAIFCGSNRQVLFYSAAYNVKDGDVLGNQLTCLSWPTLPCGAELDFPAFVTGGSYKVEIVAP